MGRIVAFLYVALQLADAASIPLPLIGSELDDKTLADFKARWVTKRALAPSGPAGEPTVRVVGPHNVCPDAAPQFSGLLPVGGDARYFFWLAMSRSKTQSTDPLVVWLSGGPGCSSTMAFLKENGPCTVVRGSDSKPTLEHNPSSWTEAANVMWVDQPAGVGFSEGTVEHGDEIEVAEKMYAFFVQFYKEFPDLQSVPLYIIGESYAGHYIPAIAAHIVETQESQQVKTVPLAGMGLGNAAVDPTRMWTAAPEFLYTGGKGGSLGHGVVNKSAYEGLQAAMPSCLDSMAKCQECAAKTECHHDSLMKCPCLETCMTTMQSCGKGMMAVKGLGLNQYDVRIECADKKGSLCYDFSDLEEYLNLSSVQTSLGLEEFRSWEKCSVAGAYLPFIASGDMFSKEGSDKWVITVLNAGLSVLVYSGDADSTVDWIGSKDWATHLNWSHQALWASKPDEDFTVAGEVAGLVRSANNFTFIQVYHAGHMVPEDQPAVSLDMVRRFISGAPLAPADAPPAALAQWIWVLCSSLLAIAVLVVTACVVPQARRRVRAVHRCLRGARTVSSATNQMDNLGMSLEPVA